MKVILAISAAIIILTSCNPAPHEAIQTAKELGIEVLGEVDHPCAEKQLEAIGKDSEDEINQIKLAQFALTNGIKKIDIQIEEFSAVNCTKVDIIDREESLPNNCDVTSLSSDIEDLGKTEYIVQDETLLIKINSQDSIVTSRIFEADDPSAVKDVLEQVDRVAPIKKHVDVNTFQDIAKKQNILALEDIETERETYCSQMLGIDGILTKTVKN